MKAEGYTNILTGCRLNRCDGTKDYIVIESMYLGGEDQTKTCKSVLEKITQIGEKYFDVRFNGVCVESFRSTFGDVDLRKLGFKHHENRYGGRSFWTFDWNKQEQEHDPSVVKGFWVGIR